MGKIKLLVDFVGLEIKIVLMKMKMVAEKTVIWWYKILLSLLGK